MASFNMFFIGNSEFHIKQKPQVQNFKTYHKIMRLKIQFYKTVLLLKVFGVVQIRKKE